MVMAKGETGGGELFQFAKQFPILVELWTLDARVSRNTGRPATLVVRIMQIKLVHSVCSSAWKLLDKCQTASVLPCSRRDIESCGDIFFHIENLFVALLRMLMKKII